MFEDIQKTKELLAKAQEVEEDNRENAREAHHFVNTRGGQWEQSIVNKLADRPRYTFDKVGPLVDQVAGEIDQADFDIRVRPAGGEATKKDAAVFDGLIRSIESMSGAQGIYATAAREMVEGGISGWMVKQEWADSDSFDQDLFIRPLNNYEDRVFWDPGSEMQDRSDANYVFVLTAMSQERYKERWPDASCISVSMGNGEAVYYHKKAEVTVGQVFYKKLHDRTLLQMSDGTIRELNEEFERVRDELAEQGIVEERRRTRKAAKVYTRIFDGQDYLTSEQETVFTDILPVVTCYANFKIREGKVLYHGMVEKLMDPQRVYNYTRSREMEEVALAPRRKYWMTKEQAAGHADTLRTLNTNADPVQFYNFDERAVNPPQQNGGIEINSGLANASAGAARDLTEAAGLFGINQGNIGESTLSGVAIQSLQNKGDNSTIKYFSSMEIAIATTARILVKAIPKVYSTKRQVRILKEDGAEENLTVNEQVFDNETQTWSMVNDLSKGKYDVTCDVGPAFKNRQQESVRALTDLAASIPGVGELSADIILSNINSPGVDLVATRIRQQLLDSGLIPLEQMTEEEKQVLELRQQQMQLQPPEPTAEDKIAEAEIKRVEAETADVISKTQERQEKSALEMARINLQANKQQGDQDLAQFRANMDHQQRMIEANFKGQQEMYELIKTQAETLKLLRDAMGADAIVSPAAARAYTETAEELAETLEENEI